MIVVIRKKDAPPHQRASGLRGHVAAVVALVALAIATGAWFWTTRQPPQAVLSLPHGVIVLGGSAFVAALIAEIRAMSLMDVLDAAWDLAAGLLALIGAILKGIWNGILGLFGWN